MVLRAFAAHPVYRRKEENKKSERVVKRYTSYMKVSDEYMRGKGKLLEKTKEIASMVNNGF